MYNVIEIRAKKTMVEPGVHGYDAEATLEDEDFAGLFVHVNVYDGYRHYTVSRTSIYNFMTGDGEDPGAKFDEEYSKLEDAERSEYFDVFKMLDGALKVMGA